MAGSTAADSNEVRPPASGPTRKYWVAIISAFIIGLLASPFLGTIENRIWPSPAHPASPAPPGLTSPAGPTPTRYEAPFTGRNILRNATHQIYCGYTNQSVPYQLSLTTGIGAFEGGSNATACGSRGLDTVNNSGSLEAGITAEVPVAFPSSSTGNVSVNLGIYWETGGGITLGPGGRCHPAGLTSQALVNSSNPHLDRNDTIGVCFIRAHVKAEAYAALLDATTGHEYPLVNATGNVSSTELYLNELLLFQTTVTESCYGPGNAYGKAVGCFWSNSSQFTGSVAPALNWADNVSSYV